MTRAAPASAISVGSPGAPVPVTFAAPTRWPARLNPRMRAAATVVLPAFIEVPSTAMVRGRGARAGTTGRARRARLMTSPSSSQTRPSGSTRVGGFIRVWEDTTRPAMPPPATRSQGPRSVGTSASNWSGA